MKRKPKILKLLLQRFNKLTVEELENLNVKTGVGFECHCGQIDRLNIAYTPEELQFVKPIILNI
jgi:hypothetical protein